MPPFRSRGSANLAGKDFWATGTYREVHAPERIVVAMSGDGTEGRIGETQLTVTLLERDGKTLVIVHQTGLPTSEMAGATQGWTESLEKLAASLAAR